MEPASPQAKRAMLSFVGIGAIFVALFGVLIAWESGLSPLSLLRDVLIGVAGLLLLGLLYAKRESIMPAVHPLLREERKARRDVEKEAREQIARLRRKLSAERKAARLAVKERNEERDLRILATQHLENAEDAMRRMQAAAHNAYAAVYGSAAPADMPLSKALDAIRLQAVAYRQKANRTDALEQEVGALRSELQQEREAKRKVKREYHNNLYAWIEEKEALQTQLAEAQAAKPNWRDALELMAYLRTKDKPALRPMRDLLRGAGFEIPEGEWDSFKASVYELPPLPHQEQVSVDDESPTTDATDAPSESRTDALTDTDSVTDGPADAVTDASEAEEAVHLQELAEQG